MTAPPRDARVPTVDVHCLRSAARVTGVALAVAPRLPARTA
jgi:hypothetical protein